jgi:methylenetetrahydrofolate--tRNA-(uracil-5-)-methyltransferase
VNNTKSIDEINIIGGGFAGVESAWTLAESGFAVTLYEQKPLRYSPAHSFDGLCELVCSNSFKAARVNSAAGLLKAEMKLLGSLTVPTAEANAVPAGGALAVDREAFSRAVTEKIKSHPNITLKTGEVTKIPEGFTIIATGPLTEGAFADAIIGQIGGEFLHFFDAAAPIITADSIDMGQAFFGARYDRGDDDYINCPFDDKADYIRFIEALSTAESAPKHEIDRVYEGCMPIEVLAKRGLDAPRFGPMKPVGFTSPHNGRRPYALVQLRKETSEGRLYNIVGFQTNLKFGEQERVFRMIPGLQNAEFARYGVMHRNSFIDSPRLLNFNFSLRKNDKIYFAGQISGVEGYMESAASGLIAGLSLARRLKGEEPPSLPKTTMLGALTSYISDESVKTFQPMGANIGILPLLEENIKGKQERYQAISERALADLRSMILSEN